MRLIRRLSYKVTLTRRGGGALPVVYSRKESSGPTPPHYVNKYTLEGKLWKLYKTTPPHTHTHKLCVNCNIVVNSLQVDQLFVLW